MASKVLQLVREDILSPKLSLFEKANKVWDYFKRGNSEIRQFIGIWNLILLFSFKLDFDLSWTVIGIYSIMFIPTCISIGLFFTKKVNITANKTNPFTQDNIQGSLHFQQSMLHLYEFQKTGDTDQLEKAIEEMKASQRLKEKWVNL